MAQLVKYDVKSFRDQMSFHVCVAQLVERRIGNAEVPSSILGTDLERGMGPDEQFAQSLRSDKKYKE